MFLRVTQRRTRAILSFRPTWASLSRLPYRIATYDDAHAGASSAISASLLSPTEAPEGNGDGRRSIAICAMVSLRQRRQTKAFALVHRLLKFVLLGGMLSAQLYAQTFDFEDGLSGWSSSGSAFEGQPTSASSILTDRIEKVRLGGDYWRGLRYPLGQSGNVLIATAAKLGDYVTGSLISPSFDLNPSTPYFSFSSVVRKTLIVNDSSCK